MDFVINGIRTFKSTRQKNKALALEIENQERKRIEERASFKSNLFPRMPTLQEAMEVLWEDRWKHQADADGVYSRFLTIIEEVGNPKLSDINSQWIYKAKNILIQGRSPATVNRYLANLKTLLRTARDEWEILSRIPKIVLFKESQGRTRVITREEQRILTGILRNPKSQAKGRRKHWPLVADLIDFLCDTGLRAGEALKLGPENLTQPGVVQLWPDDTKTSKTRVVPLTKKAEKILLRLGDKPFQKINIYQVNRAFKTCKKMMGITDPEFTTHACRHTYASRLLETGHVDLYTVQKLLGHGAIKTTERYTHLTNNKLKSAVSYLEI